MDTERENPGNPAIHVHGQDGMGKVVSSNADKICHLQYFLNIKGRGWRFDHGPDL